MTEVAETPAAKTRRASPRGIQDPLLFCVGVALLAVSLVDIAKVTLLSTGLQWSRWGFSEWLINYSAGFVRRGLAGELMLAAWPADVFVDRLNLFVFVVFSIFSLGLLLLFLVVAGMQRAFLLLIAMPGGVMTMSAQTQFFFRKEMLFHAALILLALLVCSVPKEAGDRHRGSIAAIVAAMSLAAFAILPLVHESFVFLTMPAYLYVVYVASIHLRSTILRRLCPLLAAIAIAQLLLAVIFKGDARIADGIWATLPENLRAIVNPTDHAATADAVEGIGWTLVHGLSLPFRIFRDGYVWYWIVPLAVAMLSCLVLFDDIASEERESRDGIVVAIIGIFACAAPIYLLGGDWGRWISATAISSAVAVLVSVRTGAPLPRTITRLAPPSRVTLGLFWIVLVMSLTLRTPECCLGHRPAGIFGTLDAVGRSGTEAKR